MSLRVLCKRTLFAHPGLPAPDLMLGTKLMVVDATVLRIEYVIVGPLDTLAIPEPKAPERRDELWQHTCFEAFIGRPGGGYFEFNFSPSCDWAAYRFDSYRSGMRPAMDAGEMEIAPEHTTELRFGLIVELALPPLWAEGATHLGLSAVIEEKSGRKSWWALAHPSQTPDFHHAGSFTIELPAADAA